MRTFENYNDIYLYIEPLTDNDPDLQLRYRISHTLKYLEDYLNITTNQYNRIVENIGHFHQYSSDNKLLHQNIVILFGDIHFLMIAIEKSYLLSFELLELLGYDKLARTEKQSNSFQSIKHIRNNLEHMNENLTRHDSKYNKSISDRGWYTNWFDRQWGTLANKTITLGKYSFALQKDSFAPLWSLYDRIFNILQTKYVSPSKELVDKLFTDHIKKLK